MAHFWFHLRNRFIKEYNSGYLPEKDGHKIFFQEIGNPKGEPVICFHGGPGSGAKVSYAYSYNLKKYRVIIFDQRGCGQSEYKDAFKHYNKLLELERSQDFSLYKGYGEEIFEKAGLEDLYAEPAFWAYVSYFEQIQANGGRYVSISEFNGINGIGNANSDGDWLQDMTKAGKLTIDVTTFDSKGNFTLASTSVATEASLEYTTTTTIDKAAYAKAEAEYEHKMKEINQKDKKFDMDLSKLETERTALKTEYDSVKKVIQDNIERTFGIFS